MNTEMILKSDVLDILFDNRNKSYGAYPLRKFYPERIKVALALMLGVAIIFCVYALMDKNEGSEITVFNFQDPVLKKINTAKKIEQPKQKASAPKPVFNSQKFVSIIKMEKDSADKLPDNLDKIPIGRVTVKDGVEDTGLA